MQAGPGKAQGLMLLDTSKGGWTILHSDSDIKRLDGKRTEGQYLWDVFSVPDVVSPMLMPMLSSCAYVPSCHSLQLTLQHPIEHREGTACCTYAR